MMRDLIYKVDEDDNMRFLSVMGLLEGMIRSFIQ